MTFEELGLSAAVLNGVADAGYSEPTPIQTQAIPIVLQGRDVIGCAQTGTGKTASFVLPMLDVLSAGRARARMPRSLILEPTRELAMQVADNFTKYGKYLKLNKALLIGGLSFEDQDKIIDRGADVLIATPGRLLDHFERGRLVLSDIKIFVIDEADRMLDMGFIPDVEKISGLLPALRQTLLFSATILPEIRRLADRFMMNPREIAVTPAATPLDTIEQAMLIVGGDEKEKRHVLRTLMRERAIAGALIFCNRKKDVDIVAKSLAKHGFSAAGLHGDMSQPARLETLQRFKAGGVTFLVASDVAARGLDISGLPAVINYDVPTHPEDYIHRIGRTGRAGMSGHAYTLATPDDGEYIAAIEKMMVRAIPRTTLAGIDEAAFAEGDGRRRRRGRGRGGRPARGGERRPERGGERRSDRGERRPERRPVRGAEHRTAHAESDRPAPAEPAHVTPREPMTVESAVPAAERHDERAAAAAPRAHERPPRHEPRRGRDRGPRETEPAVVGLGDHVPAFLLRSVPEEMLNGGKKK
ncbi:MAG: DEAD/DEAH box helicase [Alphaproteobacteria bacterium]|nr:DEAD/DEAH box helicase [Alphaproteobacteria bacterium]